MNGYDAPNYTQIPNILIDMDLREMGKAECKVVIAIARKTLGWHKESDRISIAQLVEMTGLTRTSVVKGTNEAIKRGIVEKIEHETGPNEYRLVVQQVDQEESSNCTRGVHLLDSEVVQQIDSQKKVVKETTTKEKDSKPLPENPEVEDDEEEAEKPKLSQHPAVQKFREVTHRYPAKSWYQDIVDVVGEDVEKWEGIVKDWVGFGWNPTNVKGMLDVFKDGWNTPLGRKNGNGKNPDVSQEDTRSKEWVRKHLAEQKARGE